MHVKEKDLFRDVRWDEVRAYLQARAVRLLPEGVLISNGQSAEDLVAELLRRFLDPEVARPTWDSRRFGSANTEKVKRFLGRCLRNHFVDQIKVSRHQNRSDIDLEAHTDPKIDVRQYLYKLHLIQRVDALRGHARASGDLESELYCKLVLERARNGDAPATNQEAAVELGLESSDIVNIKKRLTRLAARGASYVEH